MPCSEEHGCTQTYFSDICALCAYVWGFSLDITALGELAKLRLGQADNVKERGKASLLKSRPLGQDKACRKPQAMKRHVGIFPGPVCTFCFVSEYGSWHRVGVCGLEEAVFQLTGTGSLYKMGIQLGPGISRFIKLAKPLELFLSNPSLCPTHLFFYSFHPAHWIWMQLFDVAESTTLASHLRSPRVLSG